LFGIRGSNSLISIDKSDATVTPICFVEILVGEKSISFDDSDVLYFITGNSGDGIGSISTVNIEDCTEDLISEINNNEMEGSAFWGGEGFFVYMDPSGAPDSFAVIGVDGSVQLISEHDHDSGGLAIVPNELPDNFPIAEGTLLSISKDDNFLRSIDATDGSTLDVHPISYNRIINGGTGLAVDPTTDTLYALLKIEDHDGRDLVSINTDTGVATQVGSGNVGRLSGIDFDSQGILYGISGDGSGADDVDTDEPHRILVPESIYRVDKNTGEMFFECTLGNGDDGEAIAFDDNDVLFHASGNENIVLETVDLDNVDEGHCATDNIPYSGDEIFEVFGLMFWEGEGLIASDIDDGFLTISTEGVVNFLGFMDHEAKGFAMLAGDVPPPDPEPLSGSISGFVWDDLNKDGIQDQGEPPFSDISVSLIVGGFGDSFSVTDANGEYFFLDLVPDEYFIVSSLPADFEFTLQDVGSDDFDSDVDALGFSDLIALTEGENIDVDIGLISTEPEVIEVSSCGILDKKGATYLLTEDPGLVFGSCFTITADNIVFDGGGIGLNGEICNGETETYGVGVFDSNGVTVKNLNNIQDFDDGILWENSTDGFIQNNFILNNCNDGIKLLDSDRNTIEGNVVQNNGHEGIVLHDLEDSENGSDDNQIKDNFVGGSTVDGFDIEWASGNIFSGNVVGAYEATIFDAPKVAGGNGQDGFEIDDSDINTFSDNTVSDNGNEGFDL
jgi:parallel beta-helix repeat protein